MSQSIADTHFGYDFGVDGVMSYEQACEYLGSISVSMIKRLCEDTHLRRGRHPFGRRIVICRKSVVDYISKMEI